MTPPETTDEKRSRRYWGFVVVGAVVIVAAAFILWPRARGRQHLSLTVHGCSTNLSIGQPFVGQYTFFAGSDGGLLFAVVAVTNNTKETIVLENSGGSWPAHFCVLGQAGAGWKSQLWDGGPLPSKLLPGQGFTVEAAIPAERPCKVGVYYLNDRLSGRLWLKLPSWLTAKLSWASPWRTATTEVIDPSKPQ